MTNKLLPKINWNETQQLQDVAVFRIPFTLNGMKNLQLYTYTHGGKQVWANLNKYSDNINIPENMCLKDITFGVQYKNDNDIAWLNQSKTLDSRELQSFCFRGKIISQRQFIDTYKPYNKFNKYWLTEVLHNRRIQTSLWRSVKQAKTSGAWDEAHSVKCSMYDVYSRTSINSMWKTLTRDLHLKDFIVPNPATSLQIKTSNDYTEKGLERLFKFNFLFTSKIQTRRQTFYEWVNQNLAANPLSYDTQRGYEELMGEDYVDSNPF
mgnify:CR=1 FL=1